MSQRDKNLIVTILAIIGGIVVLGWLLKLTFALLGPVIVIAIGVVIYLALTKNKGGRF
ncbi:hypothetical protein [Sphingomonas sp. NFR15]|uniref:hypothetical protein n=1 Tax=Sphingomonas sp. NFR15 TaxID=1566282 RepID=UPI00088F25E4|nr:hypothetical protein [Sphingomonas sp. NFR15]SDA15959.1 hypothetical protein SAMN03159340_00782 [Sphingomonas sp. NFR15]